MYTVSSDLPSTRIKIINPDPAPGEPRNYVTTSPYAAWKNYQAGCKAILIRDSSEQELSHRQLMALGIREWRRIAPEVHSIRFCRKQAV